MTWRGRLLSGRQRPKGRPKKKRDCENEAGRAGEGDVVQYKYEGVQKLNPEATGDAVDTMAITSPKISRDYNLFWTFQD